MRKICLKWHHFILNPICFFSFRLRSASPLASPLVSRFASQLKLLSPTMDPNNMQAAMGQFLMQAMMNAMQGAAFQPGVAPGSGSPLPGFVQQQRPALPALAPEQSPQALPALLAGASPLAFPPGASPSPAIAFPPLMDRPAAGSHTSPDSQATMGGQIQVGSASKRQKKNARATGAVGIERFLSNNELILARVKEALDVFQTYGYVDFTQKTVNFWSTLAKECSGRDSQVEGDKHLLPAGVQKCLESLAGAKLVCAQIAIVCEAMFDVCKHGKCKAGPSVLVKINRAYDTLRTSQEAGELWQNGSQCGLYLREQVASMKHVFECSTLIEENEEDISPSHPPLTTQDLCSLEECRRQVPEHILRRLPAAHSAYQVSATAREDEIQGYYALQLVQARRLGDILFRILSTGKTTRHSVAYALGVLAPCSQVAELPMICSDKVLPTKKTRPISDKEAIGVAMGVIRQEDVEPEVGEEAEDADEDGDDTSIDFDDISCDGADGHQVQFLHDALVPEIRKIACILAVPDYFNIETLAECMAAIELVTSAHMPIAYLIREALHWQARLAMCRKLVSESANFAAAMMKHDAVPSQLATFLAASVDSSTQVINVLADKGAGTEAGARSIISIISAWVGAHKDAVQLASACSQLGVAEQKFTDTFIQGKAAKTLAQARCDARHSLSCIFFLMKSLVASVVNLASAEGGSSPDNVGVLQLGREIIDTIFKVIDSLNKDGLFKGEIFHDRYKCFKTFLHTTMYSL